MAVTAQEFVDGEKLRDGTDVTGTEYETTVTAANVPEEISASKSAYFSEQALDPYEVANAQ